MNTKDRLRQIIFEADTPAGKAFDVLLIISVLVSVGVVMLESIAPVEARYGNMLRVMEWIFTLAFTKGFFKCSNVNGFILNLQV